MKKICLLLVLSALIAGCASDNKSDPQVKYGGQVEIRGTASSGTTGSGK
ncbi:MAG: hypothetical protein ABFD97_02310 [Syntrophobacter sp.]